MGIESTPAGEEARRRYQRHVFIGGANTYSLFSWLAKAAAVRIVVVIRIKSLGALMRHDRVCAPRCVEGGGKDVEARWDLALVQLGMSPGGIGIGTRLNSGTRPSRF